MKRLLLSLLGLTALTVGAQDPIIDSWIMNSTGLAQYDVGSGTVTMSDSADVLEVCYDANHVYVRSEGLANYVMGPFPQNPNTPSAQGFIWKVKRNPAPETGTHTDQAAVGPMGVALNGVAIYGISDARSYDPMQNANTPNGAGLWNADAWVSEGSTMDANGNGHPQQFGQYHYHANPISLYSDPSSNHSPILGYAFDGYPIYGPFGYSSAMDSTSGVTRMASSYQLRSITTRDILPDGSTSNPPGPNVGSAFPLGTYIEDYEYVQGLGDLDEYNGRTCVTPEYPNGTYAYFIATDSQGDPTFPYMIGLQYYGQVSQTDISNGANATIPGGVTCLGITNGIDEAETLESNLYPNPASANAVLEMSTTSTFTIQVIDMASREVSRVRVSGSRIDIDVTGLDEGIYFIRVQDESTNAISTQRLIVNK